MLRRASPKRLQSNKTGDVLFRDAVSC